MKDDYDLPELDHKHLEKEIQDLLPNNNPPLLPPTNSNSNSNELKNRK